MPRHGDNLSVYQQRSGWRSCGAHTQRDATQPRKEQNSAICNSTGGPRDYHAKWSKSENDKYHTTYHTYISLIHGTWFLNMIQMDLFTKQRQTDMHGKQPCGDQRESAVGGISQELGVNAHTTIYKTEHQQRLIHLRFVISLIHIGEKINGKIMNMCICLNCITLLYTWH